MVSQHPDEWSPATHPAPPAGTGQGAPAGAPRAAGPSPFAGIPAGDYVRDGVAALLLLGSLALPWTGREDATDRIDVVLVTIVSLMSLTLPYLARVGALGTSLDPRRAGLVRALANLPYAVMVLVYLLLDVVNGGNGQYAGIGSAVALGLAGAVLAAQPRESEIRPGAPQNPVDRAWLGVVAALGGLMVLTVLISVVTFLVGAAGGMRFFSAVSVVGAVVATLLTLVLAGWPTLGTVRRDGGWRLVLIALGASAVAIYLLGEGESVSAPSVESIHYLMSGMLLWPALAAAAAAPSTRRAMHSGPVSPWRRGVVHLLTVTAVVAGLMVLVSVLTMIEAADRGPHVFLVIFALLYAVTAVVARSMLVSGHSYGRYVAYGAAGALLLLGIVMMIVVASDQFRTVTGTVLLFAFGIPVTLAVLAAVPEVQASRTAQARPVAPAAPQRSATAPGTAVPPPPAPPGTAVPAPPPPPAPVSAELRAALDPTTEPAVLAELAARAPETRPAIARHPAAYPALLEWLAALGDPEVTRALRERNG